MSPPPQLSIASLSASLSLPCSLYNYVDSDDSDDESAHTRPTSPSNEPNRFQVPFLHSYNQERTSLAPIGDYWLIHQYNCMHVLNLDESDIQEGFEAFQDADSIAESQIGVDSEDDSAGELVASYALKHGVDSFRCSEWMPEDIVENIRRHTQESEPHLAEVYARQLAGTLKASPHATNHIPDYKLRNELLHILMFSHENDELLTIRVVPGEANPTVMCTRDVNLRLMYPCGVMTQLDYNAWEGCIHEAAQHGGETRFTWHDHEDTCPQSVVDQVFSEPVHAFFLFGGRLSSDEASWDSLYMLNVSKYPHSLAITNLSHISEGVIHTRRETQAVRRDEHRIIYGYGSFLPEAQPNCNPKTIYYDDLYELDTRTWKWTQIGQFGRQRPCERCGPSMAMHPSQDFLIISGGFNSSVRFMNDIWILNLRANHWIEVKPILSPELTLDTMGYHASVVSRKYLWISNVEEIALVTLPTLTGANEQLYKMQQSGHLCDCFAVCVDEI